jgi:iron(III) transport system permease protein
MNHLKPTDAIKKVTSVGVSPPSSNTLLKLAHVLPSFKHVKIISFLLALVMALPLFTLLFEALSSSGDSFAHIRETVLTDYVINTVLLMISVGILVLVIGIPLAWLIACCDFWGKRFFNWALVLPLAMPAYLVAYTYTDLLDYAGPIQITLRNWFGWTSVNDYWFFDIRSLTGAAAMLSLVLYPYVYLMVRASFLEQNATLTHAARVLGKSPLKCFLHVSMPLARTAIIASCALVMMESMADFATVNYFAVSTLTTAVYDTWLGHYDLASAAKLSSIMVMGIFVLLFLEQLQKGKQKSGNDAKVSQQSLTYKLSKKQTLLAVGFCSLILFVAFIVPVFVLLQYAVSYFDQSWSTQVFEFALNSAGIAFVTAILALVLSLILNYSYRVKPNRVQGFSLKVASSGYAIPGTVMAIGVLIPLTFFDVKINDAAVWMGFSAPGLLLSGTVVAIIFAHLVRFIAIANKTLEASYEKISPSLDMVSKTMGTSGFSLLRKVHVPLIRKSAMVAALLIFVESMKELPAALLLRPFDFQTLPTYVYQYASDEQLELAALGAVLIVLVGLIPLLILNRSIDTK